MERFLPCLFLAGLLLSALTLSLRADENSTASGLETILSQRLPADGPGTAVLVARNGAILFSHGYGLADREQHVPATPDTRFRIGSVTKQFTAAAILRLAEENRLSIDDPLAKYFADYPGGAQITLRQLLTHTSGLHNFTAHPDFLARVIDPISSSDLVDWFKNDPADFPPGQQFRYSNTNYVLLGQIVEKVSGMSLSAYLQKQFFAPLGMTETGLWDNAKIPLDAAKGYSFAAGSVHPALDWNMTWAGGAGALYSTLGDLWRWTEALEEGRVLSAPSLKTMLTPVTVPQKETLIGYGMGLWHSELGWLPVIAHNGGLSGYSSYVMWFPGQKVTVVVLCNASPGPLGTDPGEILRLAAHAFLDPEMKAQAPTLDPAISEKGYAAYVGHYDYKTAIQEITLVQGHLFAQLTSQNALEILPSGPDAFFFKDVEARLQFDRNQAGTVDAVTHIQNGQTFTALKLAEKDLPTLSPLVLDGIVGQYEYAPLVILTVTRRGNQLYAQLTGQSGSPIFPKSATEFYWKNAPARVEFIPGPDGKITSAIHHQNNNVLTAPKIK